MTLLVRLTAALVLALTVGAVIAGFGSSAASAQTAPSSTVVESTTTTIATTTTVITTGDPLDTAPVLELKPGAPTSEPSSSSSVNGGLLVAAIVLPLIGITIIAWYWNRTKKASASRTGRSGPRPDDPQ
jgi:hypothetical protein